MHAADARERITVEIENVGKWFKETGECSAWLAASDDAHLQGVGREVNGPLFNWVVKRLGISGTPAHDMFRRGSPLVGSIQASGRGTPIEPTSLGDLWSLWDSREKDNLELIDSLKDDVLEQELHDLALLDAKLKRMSQPMPVCIGDIRGHSECEVASQIWGMPRRESGWYCEGAHLVFLWSLCMFGLFARA